MWVALSNLQNSIVVVLTVRSLKNAQGSLRDTHVLLSPHTMLNGFITVCCIHADLTGMTSHLIYIFLIHKPRKSEIQSPGPITEGKLHGGWQGMTGSFSGPCINPQLSPLNDLFLCPGPSHMYVHAHFTCIYMYTDLGCLSLPSVPTSHQEA